MGYSHSSKAEFLRKSLKGLQAGGKYAQDTLLPGVVGLTGVIAALGPMVRPQGDGGGDLEPLERIANILTSFPFMFVGCHTIRRRKTQAGKLYGASLVGVGTASLAFHSSRGKVRDITRKIDYWTIAVSSICLNSAVFPKVNPLFWVVQLAIVPFRPFYVSSANTSAMEVEYLRRARKTPRLRNGQRLHSATCCLGLGCWCSETMNPKLPLLHSAWHLAAGVSCATTNGLLAEIETSNQIVTHQ